MILGNEITYSLPDNPGIRKTALKEYREANHIVVAIQDPKPNRENRHRLYASISCFTVYEDHIVFKFEGDPIEIDVNTEVDANNNTYKSYIESNNFTACGQINRFAVIYHLLADEYKQYLQAIGGSLWTSPTGVQRLTVEDHILNPDIRLLPCVEKKPQTDS